MILDRVCNIFRLSVDVDNTNKESYSSYVPLQNCACQIQPGQAEDVLLADGTYSQTYVCFTTYSGILEGDKLIDQVTNETFIVKGKKNWMSPDLIRHTELLLTQPETTE